MVSGLVFRVYRLYIGLPAIAHVAKIDSPRSFEDGMFIDRCLTFYSMCRMDRLIVKGMEE